MLLFTTNFTDDSVTIQLRGAEWSRLRVALGRRRYGQEMVEVARTIRAKLPPDLADHAVARVRLDMATYQAVRRVADEMET